MLRIIKNWAHRIPVARAVAINLLRLWWVISSKELFPPGHYYSHTPDQNWIRKNRIRLFSQDIDSIPGIELRDREQFELLEELILFLDDFDAPDMHADGWRYSAHSSSNDFFGINCAFLLYAMLRRFQPNQVYEVGSGFSSALMLDVDERYLNCQTQFTFIEPYPARLESLLRTEDVSRCRIVRSAVQEIDLDEFDRLQENDFLFIDSSHVSKIGSDVNFLLFEVLPCLNPGVLVHFHDIDWPFEYRETFLMEGRFWNESYLLRAFVQYNSSFEIVMFDDYLAQRHKSRFRETMPVFSAGFGGSLWLRRT